MNREAGAVIGHAGLTRAQKGDVCVYSDTIKQYGGETGHSCALCREIEQLSEKSEA